MGYEITYQRQIYFTKHTFPEFHSSIQVSTRQIKICSSSMFDWSMSHDQSHTIAVLGGDVSHAMMLRKTVIHILLISFSDYYCQIWMIETHYTTPCAMLISRQEHTWYMFNPSHWAYILKQPMSTPTYCTCLGLIFFHYRCNHRQKLCSSVS